MDSFVFAGDRIVNLRNVSSISFIEDQKRVAFNMNFDVTIKQAPGRTVSAYAYWHPSDYSNSVAELCDNPYIQANFIHRPNGLVNKNEISSIKVDELNCRVIFNMSHSVSFYRETGEDDKTAEFIFVDFAERSKYVNYLNYVVGELCTPEFV